MLFGNAFIILVNFLFLFVKLYYYFLLNINTIKILFHLLQNTEIATLKFNNNNFNIKSLECLVKCLIEKENNINNLSY